MIEHGRTDFVVDTKLVFEDLIALFVDGFGGFAIVVLASVDWAPFTVPDAKLALVHPFALLLITPLQSPALFVTADIFLRRGRKTKQGVI